MTDERDLWVERFFACLDGEMSDEERAEFERDLDASPEMRAEFEAFRETLDVLHDARTTDDAPDLTLAIQSRIRRRSRGRFFAHQATAPRIQIELMVLLFGVIVGGIFLVTGSGPFRLFELPPPTPLEQPDLDPDPDTSDDADPAETEPGAAEPGAAEPFGRAEPGAEADPDRDTVTAASSAPPVLGGALATPERWEVDWIVHTDLAPDEAGRLTRQRVGRQRTREADGRFLVEVDAAEAGALLERLDDFGRVERRRVLRSEPGLTRIWVLPSDVPPPAPEAPHP